MLIPHILERKLLRLRRGNIRLLLVSATAMLIISSVIVYFAENHTNNDFQNIGDCLWWAIVTMSTVGYGDKVPETAIGQVVAFVVMVSGPVLLVYAVSNVAVSLYERWRSSMRGEARVKSEDHVIICGWNPKVSDIITELRLSPVFRDRPIAIVDDTIDAKPIEDHNVFFVAGNPCEINVLDRANVGQAKFAIVVAPDGTPAADQRTVLTVLALRSANPSLFTCAELVDPNNGIHLQRAGCEVVINTHALTSKLLAMSIENPAVNDVIEELVTRTRGNEVYRIKVPEKYQGKPFEDAFQELKRVHNMIVIGIDRNGDCIINPPLSFAMKAHDFLLVISETTPSIEEKIAESGDLPPETRST